MIKKPTVDWPFDLKKIGLKLVFLIEIKSAFAPMCIR